MSLPVDALKDFISQERKQAVEQFWEAVKLEMKEVEYFPTSYLMSEHEAIKQAEESGFNQAVEDLQTRVSQYLERGL